MTKSQTNNPAFTLLKKDHDKVKDLFDQFEKAKGLAAKKKIVDQALLELEVHAAIEEELFYPTIRKAVGKEDMNEADEEHHVAKILISELSEMNGDEEHYSAKFTVLSENVRHHIGEEESQLFSKAHDAKIDFDALCAAMQKRKEDLLANGVPLAAESVMVAASHGKGDSPAQASENANPQSARKFWKK